MSGETSQVPDSFPRDPCPSALPGAQPKLSARVIDGNYVVGLTEEERLERYLICEDLVEKLAPYTARERPSDTLEPLDAYLERLETAVRRKDWDISPVEVTWVMDQLKERLA